MIQPSQIYRSCAPFDRTRLRITEYMPDWPYACAVDAESGRGSAVILSEDLHDSPTTRDGKPRRTGYTLETR